MSRTRALARAERERVAAEQAAARAAEVERLARRAARRRRVTGWLPAGRTRRARRVGVLAKRRRRRAEAVLVLLLVLNVLLWFAETAWSARALAAVASVLVAPVLYTVLFRRS